MLVTAEGIVLRQKKIADNRRLVVLFTREYGKITAGTSLNEKSRNKSALALRPFTCAEYNLYKGRDYYNIDGAAVKHSYYSIGENIDRFLIASKLIEYLDRILEEGQPRPKFYELTQEFMESISVTKSAYATILYAFIVKSFRIQGIMPELGRCVNCGASHDDAEGKMPLRCFSVEAGGMLCRKCAERLKKSGESLIYEPSFDIVNTLQYFIDKPVSTFEKLSVRPDLIDELGGILNKYAEYYLGVSIAIDDRSLDYT